MHLSKILTPFARRFVAGETAIDGINAARRMNGRGMGAILDFLGEDVSTAQEAAESTEEYLRLLTLINQHGVRSSLSLKASQVGLLLSPELCIQNISRVLDAAQRLALFVWIDMEGSATTERTIEVFTALRERRSNVGLCLQAYLLRTQADVDRLTQKILYASSLQRSLQRVPVCRLSGQKKPLTTITGRSSAPFWLARRYGVFPAFATHDPRLIDTVLSHVRSDGISKSAFEFQMLYGIPK